MDASLGDQVKAARPKSHLPLLALCSSLIAQAGAQHLPVLLHGQQTSKISGLPGIAMHV